MTLELWILVAMGVFLIVLGLMPGIAKLQEFKLLQTGNYQRDDLPPLSGWGARAERALYNLYESLPLFTILILAAHLTNANNDMTALGAELFLLGRILHPVFYIFGPGLMRSVAWAIATSGMVLVGLQLG